MFYDDSMQMSGPSRRLLEPSPDCGPRTQGPPAGSAPSEPEKFFLGNGRSSHHWDSAARCAIPRPQAL